MKTKLSVKMMALLVGSLMVFGSWSTASAAEKEPTLQETLTWLQEKITADAYFLIYKTQRVEVKEMQMTVTMVEEHGSKWIYDIPLNELEKADHDDGSRVMAAFCGGGERKIRIRGYDRDGTPNKNEMDEGATFYFSNAVMAERVTKAFNHAIKLIKAQTPSKKEPF